MREVCVRGFSIPPQTLRQGRRTVNRIRLLEQRTIGYRTKQTFTEIAARFDFRFIRSHLEEDVAGFNLQNLAFSVSDENIITRHIGPVGALVRCWEVSDIPLDDLIGFGAINVGYGVADFELI